MEYIKTYEQHLNDDLILEKLDLNKIEEYVKKIGSNPNLFKMVDKLKKYLQPLYKNYTKDGVIQLDKLSSDIKSLSLNTSEEFDFYNTERHFDYNKREYVTTRENKILKILTKIIKAPYELVKWVWESIVDNFEDGFWSGTLWTIIMICMATLIVLLGIIIYLMVDHLINKFETGIVVNKEIKFTPAHMNVVPVTVSTGKSISTVLIPIYVPNTWSVKVKDIDGERVEIWSTSNQSYVEGIGVGDTLHLTNFNFSGKVKSGE